MCSSARVVVSVRRFRAAEPLLATGGSWRGRPFNNSLKLSKDASSCWDVRHEHFYSLEQNLSLLLFFAFLRCKSYDILPEMA